ncbi:MAG: uracil phosphoribosyltransferase [Bradymonadaceae bacterium]
MTTDRQYRDLDFDPSAIRHEYGANVHIERDPLALTQLARLCAPEMEQPTFNRTLVRLYRRLLQTVVNAEFPRTEARIPSRMQESTDRGVYHGEIIDPETSVVTVDIARGGIVPSNTCFEELTSLLEPEQVRQDHLFMSRTTNEAGEVTGAEINGDKVGGSVEEEIVLLPDPMGATGSSMSGAIDYYKDSVAGTPDEIVAMNLIITPEYLVRLRDEHPETKVYALRLDRGMSPAEVLETIPGERWAEESGLDEHDYIVPGGGGFGELMNNSWD